MVFEALVEVSRTWTASLTRVAFGALALSLLSAGNLIPPLQGPQVTQFSAVPPGELASLTLWILGSLALGSAISYVGALTHPESFGASASVSRLFRIGELGSQPLADFLKEQHAKIELVGAMAGFFFFVNFIVFLSSIQLEVYLSIGSALNFSKFGFMGALLVATIYCLVGFIVRTSAIKGVAAIDRILETADGKPPIVAKASK